MSDPDPGSGAPGSGSGSGSDAPGSAPDVDPGPDPGSSPAASDGPLVSVVVVTHGRVADATAAVESALAQTHEPLEVVVVATPADDGYRRLAARFADDGRVRVFADRRQAGAPAARNDGFAHARGAYVVILDDDAVFGSQAALAHVVRAFDAHPSVGTLAFRSRDYRSGADIPIELPRVPGGKFPDEPAFTTYFVGVGAAFRAAALADTAGFPESYVYGMEELDLSFQLLKAGHRLLYYPQVVVRHKHATEGRPETPEVWRRRLGNRVRVAVRHLPWRYVVGSTLVWTAHVLAETGSPRVVLGAILEALADLPALLDERSVVDRETLAYVASLNGRLWS